MEAQAWASGAEVARDAIKAQLTTLVGCSAFRASPRRRRLLSYLVGQTLDGNADRLKAFDVAIAVFGRDERFDPQQDPIVRMEAQRLRRDLEHYYLTEGADDPVRIDIPKGGYVPTFTARSQSAPAPSLAPSPMLSWDARRWMIAVPAVLVALIAAGMALTPARAPAPLTADHAVPLLVAPFTALSGDGAELLATGVTTRLVEDLSGFDQLRVFDGTVSVGAPDRPPRTVTLRVDGIVQRGEREIEVGARLLDATTGEVLWSERYRRAAAIEDVLAIEDELARDMAEQMALPNGPIAVAAEMRAAGNPESLSAFDCVQRARQLRRQSRPDDHGAIVACLEEATVREPGYAEAWAQLSLLQMVAVRFQLADPAGVAASLVAAGRAAERAHAIAPHNPGSLRALANVRQAQGSYAEAVRLLRQALKLRPGDPETRAVLGWQLMARGRLDEAGSLLQEAIAHSWRSPAWYHAALALTFYLDDEPARAHAEAVLGQGFCCGIGQAALAIAAAANGQPAEAQAALDRALAQAPQLGSEPRRLWKPFHIDGALVDRLVDGLCTAGLHEPEPTAG